MTFWQLRAKKIHSSLARSRIEFALRQQPSDPQSLLSSSTTNEEDGWEVPNVTMMTSDMVDMGGSLVNLINEGPITLGTDQGVYVHFKISKFG